MSPKNLLQSFPQPRPSRDDISRFRKAAFRVAFPQISDSIFFSQRVILGGISLNANPLAFGGTNVQIPSNTYTFSDFSIEFLLDEKMTVYKEIWGWMQKIVNVNQPSESLDDWREYKSSCEIEFLSNVHTPTGRYYIYQDAYPISIPQLELATNDQDDNPITLTIPFVFDNYVMIDGYELPEDVVLERE